MNWSIRLSIRAFVIAEEGGRQNEEILEKTAILFIEIIVNGLYGGLICILFLKLPFVKHLIKGSKTYFMTAYFALFIFLGIFNAFCSRTKSINIFSHIRKNKLFLLIFIFISIAQIFIIYYGGDIFKTHGLKVNDLIIIILVASSTIIINTIRKIMCKKIMEE